jgi:predicted acylesterase/phospholipase RssA/CRP-like cAMP-binding protein
VAKQLDILQIKLGQTVVVQGEVGDSLYLVFRGLLSVLDRSPEGAEVFLGTLGRGEFFGEMALLEDQPRTATVRAERDSVLLRLSRTGFEQLVERQPAARSLLALAMEHRRLRSDARRLRPGTEEVVETLGRTPLFSSLDRAALLDLEPEVQWMMLPAGEYLFRQGDPADSLYVIVNGRLRIFREQENGSEVPIGDLGPGHCVGELGLLTEEPRAAAVRTLRDAELIRVPKEAVELLQEKHPQTLLGFLRAIVVQVRASAPVGAGKVAVAIAVIRSSRALPPEIRELTKGLGAAGAIVRVTSDDARAVGYDGASEQGGADPLAVSRWLNELEARHRFILYECDPTLSAWTRRCLRQADRVLIVSDIEDDPRPSEIELELAHTRVGAMAVRKDLILVHPGHTRQPRGTAKWLALRQAEAHHHVRAGSAEDLGRMVRRISGRSVGLVLSGGAAHGFAHIGVIRALREHAIPIDRVGGTSMGSVIAAAFALDWSESEIVAAVRHIFVESKPLSDVTVPVASFLAGNRFARGLKDVFGDTMIEDMWRSFFCVSGNLTRCEPVAHRTGALAKQVRASCTIPGLIPPTISGTDLLVDGGVANNLPDDIMRAEEEGPVIAVDVGPSVNLSIEPGHTEYPSGWHVLWNRVTPLGKRGTVPTLAHILFRTAALSSEAATLRARANAALYLRPPVSDFDFLDFRPLGEIAEVGYRSSVKAIAEFKASLGL